MTTTISLDALRELAAFRAERGCALSLYLDLDPSTAPTAGDVATRVRSLLSEGRRKLRDDLDGAARDGVRADLDRLERFFGDGFDRDGAQGYAVFAAEPDGMWQALPLSGSVPDSIRIDDEFHLAPLLPLAGDGTGALVAFVSRERGSLYRLRDGRLIELADLSDDAPRRHDQGGWAQSRLQRHVDAVAREHYREVIDELERRFRALGRPRIVVVATEDTRAELDDLLAAEVADAVIGWAHAEAHAGAPQLAAVVRPVFDRWRAACEAEHLERWREEAGRAARASVGWADTLEAALGRPRRAAAAPGTSGARRRPLSTLRASPGGGDDLPARRHSTGVPRRRPRPRRQADARARRLGLDGARRAGSRPGRWDRRVAAVLG